jgi:hypothetical protein
MSEDFLEPRSLDAMSAQQAARASALMATVTITW